MDSKGLSLDDGMKINGQYYTITYYFGEYRVGQTKTYQFTIWADDENHAREQFLNDNKTANIKWIN